MRSGKELLIASNAYTGEQRWKSWWHLVSTLGLGTGLLTIACLDLPLPVCIASSLVASLVLVRLFIIYHDYMHGAILSDSRIAGGILRFYGHLVLSPPRIWKHSHDDHHKYNSRKLGPTLGTFPVMSTEDYAQASRGQRFLYALTRHPITILTGYVTIFFWEMTLLALILNPKEHYDAAVSIVLHVSVAIALSLISWQALILGMLMPMAIITCIGSYLFYAAQFPGHETAAWRRLGSCLRCLEFIELHADGFHHALVHREHRLPPCPPLKCQNPLLSSSGSDGWSAGITVTASDDIVSNGHCTLSAIETLGPSRRPSADIP